MYGTEARIDSAVASRTPQVADAVQSLLQLSDAVGGRLDELEKRLDPILQPQPPQATNGVPKDGSTFVPLANDLSIACHRIREANARIESILTRLEV